MGFDGKKQRNALTAAENALRAVADGNTSRATTNAVRAGELDQIGVFVRFSDALVSVAEAAGGAAPSASQWSEIAETLDPGPLTFLIDELRG